MASNLALVELGTSLTGIGDRAFEKCAKLNSITLPDSVTYLGECVFSSCVSLESVIIGNSVPNIANETFAGCTNLKSIVLNNSIKYIGYGAFHKCSSLKSIEIPNSVTYLGDKAFSDCINLSAVELSNSLPSIRYGTFSNCRALIFVKIPTSVTEIQGNAFWSCSSLVAVEMTNSIKTIGASAFSGCCNLKSIEIPNSVTDINDVAFSGCSGLTALTIGNSVLSIGKSAFSRCSNLNSILIPNSVIKIDDGAFMNCNIDSLFIGHGIKYLGNECFYNSPIHNVFITALTPPEIQFNTFNDFEGILHLQGDATEKYRVNEVWGRFKRELMVEASKLIIEGNNYISGEPGDTIQLKASLAPDNVTLPYIFWKSTNTKIATVDNNGLVMLMKNRSFEDDEIQPSDTVDANNSCKIIAESLYYDGPIAEVTVYNSDFNGVEPVNYNYSDGSVDYSKPYEVYGFSGVKVGESMDGLAKGIYIVRQGSIAVKVSVR